jgi:hypothetical protein
MNSTKQLSGFLVLFLLLSGPVNLQAMDASSLFMLTTATSVRQKPTHWSCIRVQNPFDLAELILNDPVKYNRSALDAIVETRETRRVNLKPKVPVIILYITASIGADGDIRFYKDIYDRDQKLLDVLNGPVVIQLPTG